jgi:C4-type Zn-finger protein
MQSNTVFHDEDEKITMACPECKKCLKWHGGWYVPFNKKLFETKNEADGVCSTCRHLCRVTAAVYNTAYPFSVESVLCITIEMLNSK